MNNQDNKSSYILVMLPIIVFVFFLGNYIGENNNSYTTNSKLTDSSMVDGDTFSSFWKAWDILDKKFVTSASTTAQDKVYGAISGLAASYGDPYTVFFPPEEAKMFEEDISGNFEGVGMEIGIKDSQLQVVSPIKNSPAYRAGVQTGDFIVKIGDQSTLDMSVDGAVKLIRGKKGTSVEITFIRPGTSEPIVKTITRDIIDIPTLDTSTKPGGIFVIKLYSFTAQSPNLFRNALREFALSGNSKLILDLRGNPGGYLDAAWDIASWYLPVGAEVVREDFGDNRDPKIYKSKGYDVFSDKLQMLILTDGGSASASEILAGALQEHGVAKLVGQKTFGKGSVQELLSITPETSLKVTIARWLTPNGHNLSHDGLDPDYVVEYPKDKDGKISIPEGKDPILDKAVEILSK